ncbi:MAG: FprA family A-type flavoprotein [candidate division WOR-3 bacterium]
MHIREIKNKIYAVGVNHWDRRLFDELIPLPDGTSYNSYLIIGSEKTALIDAVDPSKENELIENLKKLNIQQIDYVISHHAEQDHSGGIPRVLKEFPMAKVVTNAKCKGMLMDLLLIPGDKFIEVQDNETLSLGNRTLQFIFAPWVHWPETMLTYLKEERILFPCDFFGSHLATSDLYAIDEAKVYESAKRYYAEIMMPFRKNIQKHLERLNSFQIDIIAPSHGPVYNRPEFIINAYKDWTSDNVKNEVIFPYVSMHGSVEKMAEYFIDGIMKRGITIKPFNLTKTDIGELAMALVDAATVVIGTPTVLTGPHPLAVYAAYLCNALRPKTKFASIIGSYSWGGKMPEKIKELISNLSVELIAPVIAKGYPKQEDFKALDALADNILAKHKELSI